MVLVDEKKSIKMGGCCCSSRKVHQHGTTVYYYCPLALEEFELSETQDSTASMPTTRLLVDLNRDASTPNTYRSPPAPLPFDVVPSSQKTTDRNSAGKTICGCSYKSLSTGKDIGESDNTGESSPLLVSPWKQEYPKLNAPNVPTTEEEDVCPICLEVYDSENREMTINCKHHFHLSCILEWMERSDSCPICDKEIDV